MRLVFFIILALSITGCATGPVVIPVDNLASSAQTPVQDVRPKTEGTVEIFSYLITSEKYGIWRVNQNLTEPSGPRLLAHRLQEKYGTKPVPVTKIRHFVVYENSKRQLISGVLGGPLGALAASQSGQTVTTGAVHTLVTEKDFDAMSGEDEFKRALYSPSEVPAGASAFVIFIETESEGQRRFTRTVFPIKPTSSGQPVPLHQALESAIQFHLSS
ncbi:MAG: hypothetical protein ACK5TK_15600 [Betaproteobacteria bacterium]